ncbi:hypothetical protein [Streptococcus agalactiae]|uniref:hypothetical protein n=1 Tax=Streptococcus agalactiae TaxID=1311 RepID=UPI00226444D0|nr:hypothetical protein [Streptococcus agalactiae]
MVDKNNNKEWSKNKIRKETKKNKKISEAFELQRQVEIIPAKQEDRNKEKRKPIVAAYCRVSTFEESQSGSFELQKQEWIK